MQNGHVEIPKRRRLRPRHKLMLPTRRKPPDTTSREAFVDLAMNKQVRKNPGAIRRCTGPLIMSLFSLVQVHFAHFRGSPFHWSPLTSLLKKPEIKPIKPKHSPKSASCLFFSSCARCRRCWAGMKRSHFNFQYFSCVPQFHGKTTSHKTLAREREDS